MRTPWLLLPLLLLSCSAGPTPGSAQAGSAPPSREATSPALPCDLSKPLVEHDGKRRLALLVGVSNYANPDIPRLESTRADVRLMNELLTQTGYGFPAENICILEDKAATLAGIRAAFQQALVDRARPGDAVVFYFSGHGTQLKDGNHDEPDGLDEALVPFDGFEGTTGALRDDVLNGMLAELFKKTKNITIILDACTSASATKGVGLNIPKFTPPPGGDYAEEPGVVGAETWTPMDMGDLVLATAARDGTPANATPDGSPSRFTQALASAMTSRDPGVVTWMQVARRTETLTGAATGGTQLPIFQGDLNREVFGLTAIDRPIAWEVKVEGGGLALLGLAMPGWGEGALVSIYPGNASRADVADPKGAVAQARLEEVKGTRAKATILSEPKRPIKDGDLAVLARPAVGERRLRVGIDSTVPGRGQEALKAALGKDPYGALFVQLGAGVDFLLRRGADGQLELVDPKGIVRNSFGPVDAPRQDSVVQALVQHAQQRSILEMTGEGGEDFENDKTLLVELLSAKDQTQCRFGGWVQACPNQEQIIPLCSRWLIRVTNTHPTARLVVGGVVLSSDGALWGVPTDDTRLELGPGEQAILDPGLPFEALPPTEALEHVVIVGRRASEPQIPWGSIQKGRPKGAVVDPLTDMIAELIQGDGTKGTGRSSAAANTWTTSHVAYRVTSNPDRYAMGTGRLECNASKEYSIQNFDITPYLPEGPDSDLARVLRTADELVTYRKTDGVPYRQHDWSARTDQENLSRGIDCSRAIWYAFTRSDLAYAGKSGKSFLPTAQMFDRSQGSCSSLTPERTLMHEQFDSCLGQPLQTGDVLVWQGIRPGTTSCVGHTVMVVDPDEFIGWGSHGWDGSKDDEGVRLNDIGVEYQRIGKRTWEHWDRDAYQLKACWRHESFEEPIEATPTTPYRSLSSFEGVNPCDEATCPDRTK